MKLPVYTARLGDKGLFCSANILQIADVDGRVVFLLFLLCFKPTVRLFLPRETSELLRHFVLTTKTIQPRPQVSSVNFLDFWQLHCTIDVEGLIVINDPERNKVLNVMGKWNYPICGIFVSVPLQFNVNLKVTRR